MMKAPLRVLFFAVFLVASVVGAAAIAREGEVQVPLTTTERLFSLLAEFTPDFNALIQEKLPFVEKMIEEYVPTSSIFKTSECVEDMKNDYLKLEASIAAKDDGFRLSEKPVITTKDFNLKAFLDEKIPIIETALVDSMKTGYTEQTKLLMESAKYTLLAGGKRIRPLMTLVAYEMIASPTAQSNAQVVAMPAALAGEMIHTMSLITDDMPSMDNDSMRRGLPSNHVVYGENVAMLAAGSLMSFATQFLIEETKNVEPKVLLEVVRRLAMTTGATGMAGGEMMDLLSQEKVDPTMLDLEWIHLHKTAVLFKYAVTSGGLLGGATADEVAALETYGENIGIAFQIIDDILDITQDSETLGKTAGKDEAMNKLTYPKLLGLEGAYKEAERLTSIAKQALSIFGDRAIPLIAIADRIVDPTQITYE